jgi:hypothetical protein
LLPQDWFNYYSYTRLTSYNASSPTGQMYSFCSSLDDTAHIPLVQLGGTTVFTQTPKLTTSETFRQPLTMQMALNWKGISTGRLSLDDGTAIGNIQAGQYNAFTVSARISSKNSSAITGAIRYSAQHLASQYDISGLFIQRVVLMGADLADALNVPTPLVTVAGKTVPLNGMELSVLNGALVLQDKTGSILPAGQNWQIRWIAAT